MMESHGPGSLTNPTLTGDQLSGCEGTAAVVQVSLPLSVPHAYCMCVVLVDAALQAMLLHCVLHAGT
jgi:hypothetical protein